MIDTLLKSYKAANAAADVGAKGISAIISGVGRQSIAKMSKDSIFQFSTIVSDAIDTEEIQTILKSTEQVYATMLLSALTLQGSVDRSKYKDTVEFLRRFHTNDLTSKTLESTGVKIEGEILDTVDGRFNSKVMESLWADTLESQLDMSVLNDTYKPFASTKKKLKDRIQFATEASMDDIDDMLEGAPNARNLSNSINNALNGSEDPIFKDSNYRTSNSDGKLVEKIDEKNAKSVRAGKADMIKSDKLASMEPTMIQVTMTNYNDSAMWSQNITLGVKTMPRLIPSGVMIESLISATKDRVIFKFIKWTKGEYKLSNLLADAFGITAAKEIANGKNKWFAALSKRRAINNVSKFVNKRLLPNCTIVITDAEYEEIKRVTGNDLKKPSNVRNLLNKYFLLGFAIYDTDSKLYQVMYDSDADFTTYPMRALIAQSKKDIVLANR